MPRKGRRQGLDVKQIDKNVWEATLERMHYIYDSFDTVAVSFSGGKDSTVTLHAAHEVAKELKRLPLIVIHSDEEAIPYQTEEYVRRVSQNPDFDLRWYCLPVRHRNACARSSPWWFPWDPDLEEKWVRPLPPEGITWDMIEGFPTQPVEARIPWVQAPDWFFPPETYGRVANCMGIRAAESLTRHRAVINHRVDNYIKQNDSPTSKGNIFKVYPIYDWKQSDVWTAPNVFGWDYNRAYDVMMAAGLPVSEQRCSPAYGEEPLQKFWTYSVCFPEIWDKMIDRVPGAHAASLYARTELYGFGSKPIKPDNVSWEEYLRGFILKFPNPERKIVANRVRLFIEQHYAKTKEPILYSAIHPDTGVSWEFLLMIAMRGDFKERKAPGASVQVDKKPELRRRYDEALATFRATGKD